MDAVEASRAIDISTCCDYSFIYRIWVYLYLFVCRIWDIQVFIHYVVFGVLRYLFIMPSLEYTGIYSWYSLWSIQVFILYAVFGVSRYLFIQSLEYTGIYSLYSLLSIQGFIHYTALEYAGIIHYGIAFEVYGCSLSSLCSLQVRCAVSFIRDTKNQAPGLSQSGSLIRFLSCFLWLFRNWSCQRIPSSMSCTTSSTTPIILFAWQHWR